MTCTMASPSSSSSVTSASASIDLSVLQTEGRNDRTGDIDVASTEDMCCKLEAYWQTDIYLGMINAEDQTVAMSVARCIPTIAKIIDSIAPRVRRGGRVIYVGAGTSGRLGVLDAAEIPPTFSAPYGQWIGYVKHID